MSKRHSNVKCMTTWCKYWIRTSDTPHGEHVGGCNAWTLQIATISGDKQPTCMTYKVSDDPQKAGIHSSEEQKENILKDEGVEYNG